MALNVTNAILSVEQNKITFISSSLSFFCFRCLLVFFFLDLSFEPPANDVISTIHVFVVVVVVVVVIQTFDAFCSKRTARHPSPVATIKTAGKMNSDNAF
jgi:formate hydrogenlyase subunit 4